MCHARSAQPRCSRSSTWESVLSWWDAVSVAFLGSGGEQESGLSVAVGREGARISPNGFAPTDSMESDDDKVSQQNTLNPDEPPTEAGPKISPNG